MNRGIITISESGTVSMPTDTVWMTMQEIADMYNVFGCYVRKAVKAVGINAAIQPVTWESWVQDTYSNRQFQSTVVGVDASNMTARAMLERFVSTASRDFINYNNADYDALFAQAQACYDDGEQTALYRAMEKNLAENAANVYIQDMADFVAVRDGLEGPSFYPIYVLDLSTIHYTK